MEGSVSWDPECSLPWTLPLEPRSHLVGAGSLYAEGTLGESCPLGDGVLQAGGFTALDPSLLCGLRANGH